MSGKWKPTKEQRDRQDKYIQARTSGMSGNQARAFAEYGASRNPSDIEKIPYVAQGIKKILDDRGLTDEYLADKYQEAIEECSDSKTARLKDLNAKTQLLKQLGYLRGHGKKDAPGVAVQINNNTRASGSSELGSTPELLSQVRDTLDIIRKELQNRGVSDGLHLRSLENGNPQAHQDVVEPIEDSPDVSGGSSS